MVGSQGGNVQQGGWVQSLGRGGTWVHSRALTYGSQGAARLRVSLSLPGL